MYRMDGIPQGAMEGGAVMYRMYGISQRARDGGAMNVQDVQDVRYIAKSQGWRCDECTGCTVFHKEPGMAVRRMYWMYGIPQGARDGSVATLFSPGI